MYTLVVIVEPSRLAETVTPSSFWPERDAIAAAQPLVRGVGRVRGGEQQPRLREAVVRIVFIGISPYFWAFAAGANRMPAPS